jgi:thiol-disulfide isomerase/thioredoxin
MAPEFRGSIRRGLFAALVFAASSGVWAFPAEAAQLQPISTRPPPFVLTDAKGNARALDAQRGHVVIVHFFATWCEPCREELPALNRLAERSNGAVRVLAISVAEPDDRVERFLRAMPVQFPVLLDRDRAVAKSWNVATLPSSFILDADLKPRLAVETDFAWDTIDPATLAGDLPATTQTKDTSQRREVKHAVQ